VCQSKDDGGRRCAAHAARQAAAALIPRRGSWAGYYRATDAKHFPAGGDDSTATPGSTFTDPSLRRLNDVVALAFRQRGSLEGDDREELARLGTPEEAFKPGIRYLLVHTPGTVGIRRSDDLPDEATVRVVRSKPGAPCSLVVDVTEQETTRVGTIIIGRESVDPPQSESADAARDLVFTAHPGLPIPVDFTDRMSDLEGQHVPMSVVREVYGGDVWLNTRLLSQP
jgi:hypothetical protein